MRIGVDDGKSDIKFCYKKEGKCIILNNGWCKRNNKKYWNQSKNKVFKFLKYNIFTLSKKAA